jgi:hypothetical protein
MVIWASDLVAQVQHKIDVHGDCPVYAVTADAVLAVTGTGYDCYSSDEGVVVEILTEDGDG